MASKCEKNIFTIQSSRLIGKITGDEYTFRRGAKVGEFIETLAGKARIHENEMDISESEAIEAF